MTLNTFHSSRVDDDASELLNQNQTSVFSNIKQHWEKISRVTNSLQHNSIYIVKSTLDNTFINVDREIYREHDMLLNGYLSRITTYLHFTNTHLHSYTYNIYTLMLTALHSYSNTPLHTQPFTHYASHTHSTHTTRPTLSLHTQPFTQSLYTHNPSHTHSTHNFSPPQHIVEPLNV